MIRYGWCPCEKAEFMACADGSCPSCGEMLQQLHNPQRERPATSTEIARFNRDHEVVSVNLETGAVKHRRRANCKCKDIHNGECLVCGRKHIVNVGGMTIIADSRIGHNQPPIVVKEIAARDRWKAETITVDGTITKETLMRGIERMRDRGGTPDPAPDRYEPLKKDLARREQGEGLRARGGKYTEPGEMKIYADNDW